MEMRLAALCLAALAVADALSAQPATGTKPAAGTKAKRVLVPIADGTEEIEVVTVVDVLRRAGANETALERAKLIRRDICGAKKLPANADRVTEFHEHLGVVIPGGRT